MKRVGRLWAQVASFDNLLRAAARASLGKRDQRQVAAYLFFAEPRTLELLGELEAGTWRPGPTTSFSIFDPKPRRICVAPFRDRVVHHAVIDVVEPQLDRRRVFESFACRRGKGTHAALDYAQHQLRRFDAYLKLDIRKFFASLRHDVVLATVERRIKDRRVLDLLGRIVRHGDGGQDPDYGLPIGNLTSQWLANLTLDRLDHFIKEEVRVPGYVRYMDDFVLFAQSKQVLRCAKTRVEAFLDAQLELRLKPQATLLGQAWQGLRFLGWRLHRRVRRLRRDNARRSLRGLRHREWEHACGYRSEAQLADCARSIIAHLEQGNTLGLRRAWFEGNRVRRAAE